MKKIKMSTMVKATWMCYGIAAATNKIAEKKGSMRLYKVGVAAAVTGTIVSIATEGLMIMGRIEYV